MIFTYLKKCILSTLLLGTSLFLNAKVVIWDLGYTLVQPDHMACAGELGLLDALGYGLFNHNAQHDLKQKVYEVLASAGTQQDSQDQLVRDYEGNIMPLISAQWFNGTLTSSEILPAISTRIEELDKADFFTSDREKRLVTNTIRLMFNPEVFAPTIKPIKKAVKLMRKCAHHNDRQGNKNIMMIGSNWDPASFELIYTGSACSSLFKHIRPENIVISGAIHCNKPHPAFFEHILKNYNIRPEDCVFIDDQEENLQAARKLGITGLHIKHDKKGYKTLKRELQRLGVLPRDLK
jgi:beta-phosphoglucomutase-like phosphatase (HAD superfamily)